MADRRSGKEIALETLQRQAYEDLEAAQQQANLAAAARLSMHPFCRLLRFPEKRLLAEEEKAQRARDRTAERYRIVMGITDFQYASFPNGYWLAIVEVGGQRITIEDRVIGTTKIDFVGNLHFHHDTVARIDGKSVARTKAYQLELRYVPLVRQLTAIAERI